ncbi:hypothetical protein LCGC14_0424900 [marine sediment metagenome]|uniref:Uncharacterized protein n=1 Tax=marine sediment metagenome TaxID=412755 RepID=A0A0F9VZ78_9ZZZZ
MIMWILSTIWMLPATIPIWLFYIGPALLLGWLRFDGWAEPGIARLFVNADNDNWHSRAWEKWGGLCLPHAVILAIHNVKNERHELRHHRQWEILGGVLFPIVYGALLAVYGYENHPLEQDAKKAADRGES